MKANNLVLIFDKCVEDYHKLDIVNQEIINPFEKNSFEAILYRKCWIDTVQWHYEDIIRDEGIRLLGVGISNFQDDAPSKQNEQLTLLF